MIVACRPQVPTETAAHATAQQALTKISIGGQSAGSTAAYWRCAELVHVCRKCPPHFLRADLMGPWGQIQESQHFLHSHPACCMEAGVCTACACEISKAMELKAFCGSPSATRLKKVAFSRQSCLFLPNEIDSKIFGPKQKKREKYETKKRRRINERRNKKRQKEWKTKIKNN